MDEDRVQITTTVHDLYWNSDINCARTSLVCLGQIFNVDIPQEVYSAAVGMHGAGGFRAQCGLVEGPLMFLGLFGALLKLDDATIIALCKRFAEHFLERFGSLRCCELRPGGFQTTDPPHLCEGLTVDAICFTVSYIRSNVEGVYGI